MTRLVLFQLFVKTKQKTKNKTKNYYRLRQIKHQQKTARYLTVFWTLWRD